MARLVKCMRPCIWIPSTHTEVKHGVGAYNPQSRAARDRRIPRAHGSARLAELVSSRFSEGPGFKK